MTMTGTPRPFKSQSLKVRLAQVQESRAELLAALELCVADHVMLLARLNDEMHISSETALALLRNSTGKGRAAIARAKETP